MKRVLLFLVVFGTGFMVLWLLQRDPDSGGEPADVVVIVDEPEGDTGLIDIAPPAIETPVTVEAPVAVEPETPTPTQTGSRAGLSGRIDYKRYPEEGGEAIFVLTAEDSRTSDEGWLEIEDIVLSYPGVGKVTAKRGRVILEASTSRFGTGSIGSRIELEGALLELASGHPFAPAMIQSPRFVGELDSRIFDLLDRPQLDSSSVRLDGQSIRLFLLEHRAIARGQALAQVLDVTGKMERSLGGEELTFSADESGVIQLDARGGGLLRLESSARNPQPVTLRAPSISLAGLRTGEGPTERFELTGVEVSGGRGELTSGSATASGERFEFQFDETGRAGQVVIEGAPRAQLPTSTEETLTLSAEKSLTLTLEAELELHTAGLSTLEFGDLTLTAGAGFVAQRETGSEILQFTGHGGMHLFGDLPASPGETLRTIEYRSEELHVDHRAFVAGTEVRFTSRGPTTLDLLQAEEVVGAFRADAGLTLELIQTSVQGLSEGDPVSKLYTWTIPLARELTFDFLSKGLRTMGSAASVVDFDPVRFHVEGEELTFERATPGLPEEADARRVHAAGALVQAIGEGNLVLEGSAEVPASFSSASLRLRATSLRRLETSFFADGLVHAEIGNAPDDSSFDCERLLVEGLDLDAVPPTARRMVARGNVVGSAALGGQRLGLEAQKVELLRPAGSEADSPDRLRVELRATTDVRLLFEEGQYAWSIEAGSLNVLASGSSSAPPEDGGNWLELVARDSLVVREASRDFFGRGDALFIDRGPGARVLLEGGEELAYISGNLPGAGGSYRGTVARLKIQGDGLGVDEGVFEAEELDGVLRGLFVPGGAPGEGANMVHVTCGRLTASVETLSGNVRDVLQLDDRIRILRDREDALADSFRADHATFIHERAEGDQPDHGFDAEHTAFLAHGQVRLRRGYAFLAYGDHLTMKAGTQMLRFEGTPAAIIYAGLCSLSTWITLDAETMLLECGGGSFSRDPAMLERLTREAMEDEVP